MSSRKICITAADGQTGRLAAELLLTHEQYSSKFQSLSLLAFAPEKCADLQKLGGNKVSVIEYKSNPRQLLQTLQSEGCDTMFLIPPAREDKVSVVKSLVDCAAAFKSLQNIVFLSSAGCDMAERDSEPALRSFIDMETLVMKAKADVSAGSTGHSPCIIRYLSRNPTLSPCSDIV